MIRPINVDKTDGGVLIVLGDPDARDNSNEKMVLTETEAAILMMKLKMKLGVE